MKDNKLNLKKSTHNLARENALIPGSFNPVHVGHLELIRYAAFEFRKVYVLVANNELKQYPVPLRIRRNLVWKSIKEMKLKNVTVIQQNRGERTGYIAEQLRTRYIVRGLREREVPKYEQYLADRYLEDNPKLRFHYIYNETCKVSSSLVHERLRNGHGLEGLVPKSLIGEITVEWKGN